MDKLLEIISEIVIPSAYDHFAQREAPKPPFITYLTPGSNNFSADGRVYFPVTVVHLELYTDEKNLKRNGWWRTCWTRTAFSTTSRRSGLNPKNCTKSCIHSKWRDNQGQQNPV